MKIICGLILSIILITSFIPSSYAYDKNFTYELVFASVWKDCSQRNINALEFYESLIEQYLKANNLNPINISTSCQNYKDVIPFYPSKGADLTIIIPDMINSYIYKYATNNLGVAYWSHQNGFEKHAIISTSLGLSSNDKFSAWVLSHELMHFVINYKGYDKELHEKWVHKLQETYNEHCYYNLNNCPNVWTTVKGTYGNLIPVMKPLILPEHSTSQQETTENNLDKNLEKARQRIEQETKTTTKLPTYFTSNMDSKTEHVSFSNQICPEVKLRSSAGVMPNTSIAVKIEYITKQSTKTEFFDSVKTNEYGNFYNCWEFDFKNSQMPVDVYAMFMYYGDSKFRSSQSDTFHFSINDPRLNPLR